MSTISESSSLAAQYYAAGDFSNAEQMAREALAADANNGEAWHVLGFIALKSNDAAQAFDFLNRSLQCIGASPATKAIHPMHAGATVAALNGEFDSQLRSDYANAYYHLGRVFWGQRRRSIAFAALEVAAQLTPDDGDIVCHLADLHHEVGRSDAAAHYYREALRIDPFRSDAATRLGVALVELGDLDDGVAQFRYSLQLQPNQPRVYFFLSSLASEGWCRLSSGELERIQSVVGSERHSLSDRSECAFALGAVLNEQGSYDEAMSYYHYANVLKKRLLQEQSIHFDAQRYDSMIDQIIAIYDREYFKAVRGWGVATELPVFIVGMPRSGSTLVEQILASHPNVFGAGEVGDMQAFLQKFDPRGSSGPYSIPHLANREAAQRAGSVYHRWAGTLDQRAVRTTNKTLDNFLYLGIIATLFPQARIIHCRRDALDLCLSCYMTNFATLPFPWTLEDIGAYYRGYERLMAHWTSVLPMTIKDVRYESLVGNPKSNMHELISYCGLEWDEHCLEFYRTRRAVATCSTVQVRKPINNRAVGRWRHYRSHLTPLFKALGLTLDGTFTPPATALPTVPTDGSCELSRIAE